MNNYVDDIILKMIIIIIHNFHWKVPCYATFQFYPGQVLFSKLFCFVLRRGKPSAHQNFLKSFNTSGPCLKRGKEEGGGEGGWEVLTHARVEIF